MPVEEVVPPTSQITVRSGASHWQGNLLLRTLSGQSKGTIQDIRILQDITGHFHSITSLATRPQKGDLIQTVCTCTKCPPVLGDIVKLPVIPYS